MPNKKDREAVSQGLSDIFGSRTTDLLSSIIQSDRRRAGRHPTDSACFPSSTPASPQAGTSDVGLLQDPPIMTSHTVSKQYANMTSRPAIVQADNPTDKQAANVVSVPADKPAIAKNEHRQSKRKVYVSGRPELISGRVSEAERMGRSSTTTVTLRLPRELNDWLDEYVHRAWPEKIRKQELVIEALRILFARRGRPGELLIETELLQKAAKDP